MSVTARNIGDLLRWVSSIRSREGGDLSPGWEDRVCNKVCEDPTMSSCCSGGPGYTRKIMSGDLRRFLVVVTKWVKGGGQLVDRSLAEKRAAICAECPQNVPVRGCMGCSGVIPKLLKLVGDSTTSLDDKLQGCNVCGCQLKAKVHLPAEVMVDGPDDADRFPSHCWIKTEDGE